MSPIGDSRFAKNRSEAGEHIFDDGVVRREYIKSLAPGVIGLCALAVIAMLGLETLDEVDEFVAMGFVMLGGFVLGVVVMLVLSVLLSMDAGPLNLVMLRVASITLAVTPVVGFFMGFPVYGWIVTSLIYFGLVLIVFDFEVYEAGMVTLAMFILSIVGLIVLSLLL